MGDLTLSGTLNLMGSLVLAGDGGKVTVDGNEVLVEDAGHAHGAGVPVILPPPPASPVDTGTDAKIFKSFNSTVTTGGKAIVTMGLHLQGNIPTWPGMVLPSSMNPAVTINFIQINVAGDQGITLPNSGPVTYNSSGQ
ncbi:MAG: hypothetical protein CSB13_09225 [Chloroflexi bacterium]|nr:MAG: hypothetical protein CSB13_09225 [Chloroflexota bacterium]